jgi:hypothetical protein
MGGESFVMLNRDEATGSIGLAMLLVVVLSAWAGCKYYQVPSEPEFAPPEKPGDRCSDWAERGHERPCPDGMKCTGALYERRKMIEPNRCQVVSGRCTTQADCATSELCARKAAAIGYCAPAPGLVPAAPANAGTR